MFLIDILLCAITLLPAHDFHVSVTNAEYNKSSGNLQVTMKVFSEDLEDALSELHQERVSLANAGENEQHDLWLIEYIRDEFVLVSGKDTLYYDYIGHEIEMDICFIYMEVRSFPAENELFVRNSLFFDRFDDQSNIVNISLGGKVYSVFLDPQNPVKKVQFDQTK